MSDWTREPLTDDELDDLDDSAGESAFNFYGPVKRAVAEIRRHRASPAPLSEVEREALAFAQRMIDSFVVGGQARNLRDAASRVLARLLAPAGTVGPAPAEKGER